MSAPSAGRLIGSARGLEAVLRQVGDGLTVQDGSGALVYANDAAARMVGVSSAEELLTLSVSDVIARFELYDEDGRPFPLERLPGRIALVEGRPAEAVVRYRVRATGEERWSVIRATPVFDDEGAVELAVNVFHDVTERRRTTQRERFLAEASDALAESLDYDRTLARVAKLAVPRLGDWCMVYMREENGAIARLAVEHAFGLHVDVLRQLRDYPFDLDAPTGVPYVLRTGESLLVPEADSRLVASDVVDAERLAADLESLGICSWMCVPLTARGRTLGAISVLAAESGRRFDEHDLALAQELARRAALAVDNARLYAEARESLALLDTLFSSAPVGMAFLDPELRFVRVNEALAEINGAPAAAHVGRSVNELLPEMSEGLVDALQSVVRTGEPLLDVDVVGETPAQPGATRRWVVSYYPVRDAEGTVLGLGAVIVETTERWAADEALRYQSELTRTLSENAASALFLLDAGNRITYLNPAAETMTGYSAAELEGRHFHEALHHTRPDGSPYPVAECTIMHTVDEGRLLQGHEDMFIRKDGSFFPVSVSARPIKRGGEPVGTVVDVRDVTVEKRIEEERAQLLEAERRARRRLEFLAEASRLLAGSLDYEKTLVQIARLAVPEVTDWCALDVLDDDGSLRRLAVAHAEPEKEQLAHELVQRYPPDPQADRGPAHVIRTGAPELVAHIPDALLAAAAHDADHLAILRRLGFRSYVCVPIRARGGTLGALTWVSAESGRSFSAGDVELAEEVARRAAAAIDNARLYREAEKRARAAQALEFVGDGVLLVGERGDVLLWNPAAARITGLAPADIVGRPTAEALPGWDDLAARVPIGGRPETLPVDLDGRELWLSISGVTFPGGTVYAFRDVTSERGLEQMKSEFVSTVSHELRTPLAAIYGAAQTLRHRAEELAAGQREDLVGVIVGEADRLARIVNDILWASRLESGRMHVSIASCDPMEIARDVVRAAEVHAPDGVVLALEAAKQLPSVAADADKVRQVLANLLENAVKYSPDGGRVELRVEPVRRAVRFSVHDEGLGIPPAEHERVFEKFYRLDPDLTRGVGGTGLGLYICRELVGRMGGRIWVASNDGPGSTFSFELPRADD